MMQPALLGGLVIGVLSALPIINLANCCCAWVLLGGGLAAYLMQQGRSQRVTAGEGALVGLMAGAIGAGVWALLSVPLHALLGPFQAGMIERALQSAADMPPEVRSWLESLREGAVLGVAWVLSVVFTLVVDSFFGMLGGVLGALFFAKDEPPPPPVPDPAFAPPDFQPPPLPRPPS